MQKNLSQIVTLISFELERAFTRKQSLIYLSAFAFLWYLIIRYIVLEFTNLSAPNAIPLDWANSALSTYFKIALYIFCLLSMLACANQTCTDRVRGTLRFLTLRCSRESLFSARFISQLCIFSILILICTAALLAVLMFNIGFEIQLLASAGLYALVLVIAVTPFIALMALLSVLINTARKVSVAAVFIWALAASIIAGLSHYFPFISVFEYLIPGSQFDVLLSEQGVGMLALSYVPLLQAAVLYGLGLFFMKRQAL